LALGMDDTPTLNQAEERNGLYSFFKGELDIENIIQKTDLHTLDVIPETFELNLLEKELRSKTKRESFFKNKVIPKLKNYEVIIFDNSPNWNLLIENSLVASDTIIAPISCEIGTYQALGKNLNALIEFKTEMELEWDNYIMVPTLIENNKISKEILGSYVSDYPEETTNGTIRRTVKGQESMALMKSIFEYLPKSDIAKDYDSLITELWTRINKGNC
jgi:chromosome partitioning protein